MADDKLNRNEAVLLAKSPTPVPAPVWIEIREDPGWRYIRTDMLDEVGVQGFFREVTDSDMIERLELLEEERNAPALAAAAAHFESLEDDDCWNCDGSGYVVSCEDEGSCLHPEEGCDLCTTRCRICNAASGVGRDDEEGE